MGLICNKLIFSLGKTDKFSRPALFLRINGETRSKVSPIYIIPSRFAEAHAARTS